MRIPTYDSLQVMPTVQPSPGMAAPAMPDVAGRQMQEQGQAMQNAAVGMGRIAIDMQTEANQLRVIKASNEAKEQMFNLLYDKDSGAFNQKGWNALNRPDGKDLATEYTDKFGEVTRKLSQELGNDAQRMQFQQHADSMRLQMFGETQRHLAGEFKTFKISELDGSVSTAKREISLVGASGNIARLPDGSNNLDNAIARITGAIKEKARMLGLSQEQADVMARKEISDAHALAIGGAMEAEKTAYAASYFDKYRGQMDADDILRV
ncbi:MAG: lysin, partial [Betaproteobacteria bacterium]